MSFVSVLSELGIRLLGAELSHQFSGGGRSLCSGLWMPLLNDLFAIYNIFLDRRWYWGMNKRAA